MQRTAALQRLVERLETSGATISSLGAALRSPISIEDVAPWIQFDAGTYRRHLVASGKGWELRLLCWQPGQSTTLHGHDASACAFRVLRGSVGEIVLGERDRIWAPGAIVEETTPLVHQMSNVGPDALVTLHAYSPALPVDAPSRREGHTIAIIGGGFAGVAAAYHLLRRGPGNLRIVLIERGPWLGRGIAYGVESPFYRLNVPASRMSIDPREPNDFVAWAGAESHPNDFLPRARYGTYVEQRFASAIRGSAGKLRVVRAEVAAIDGSNVVLGDGRRLRADAIVLATGLAPRIAPQWLASDPRIIDSWDECGLATVPNSGRILILGAGLSALDVLGMLHVRAFRGEITVLSRHGLLPRPHLEPLASAPALDAIEAAPRALRDLIPWVRASVDAAVAAGMAWQQGFDSIRPHVRRLWRGMDAKDRSRFIRLVRPYWDVHRHRAPPDMLAIVDAWRRAGVLRVLAGRVTSCDPSAGGLDVALRLRGSGTRHERYDAVVRCIGPALEQRDMDSPLLSSLIGSGAAMRDPAGLGVVTANDGALVDAGGRPSSTIFALGALRRAADWESTAVPEISQQASELAQRLLA